MDVKIICALISTGGIALSGLISWFVSRSSASKEIEKMKMEWDREDVVSSDDEFAEMCSSVAAYIHHIDTMKRIEAASRVASVRSKEQGQLAELLDILYSLLIKTKQADVLDEALTNVIEEKRNRKSAHRAPRNQPPTE